jgi:DNA-binding CsgD family transcriptional regulator
VKPIYEDGVMIAAVVTFDAMGDGAPRADRPSFGWEGLTDTEQTPVELVADGLTNREAAARLYLSHHTVDSHLRHIFRKLRINSRVQLARIAASMRTDPTRESA